MSMDSKMVVNVLKITSLLKHVLQHIFVMNGCAAHLEVYEMLLFVNTE